MKLSDTTRDVFVCLAQGRSAYFDSVVRASEDAGIRPSRQDGKYVFHFNQVEIAVVEGAEWVGGDRWQRFADAVLGREAIAYKFEPARTSDKQVLSAPTMSPVR
jgi:hypothetical protein